jgi:hypothetical protein
MASVRRLTLVLPRDLFMALERSGREDDRDPAQQARALLRRWLAVESRAETFEP